MANTESPTVTGDSFSVAFALSTRAPAIARAQAEAASTETNVTIMAGRAPLYPGQLGRDVWIVLFPSEPSPRRFEGGLRGPPEPP